MKTLKQQVAEMGYTPGNDEFRKAYQRLCWERRSPESKKRCGKKGHSYVRQRMARDPEYAEKMRALWRKRKAKQRMKRGDDFNAKQREWYHKNREKALESIKRSRHRRDPARGLATLLNGIKNGDRKPAELLEYARTAVDKLNSLGSRSGRSRLSGSNNTRRKNSKAKRTESGQCSPTGRPTSGDDQTGSGSGGSENEG